jgi:hypothetical protein
MAENLLELLKKPAEEVLENLLIYLPSGYEELKKLNYIVLDLFQLNTDNTILKNIALEINRHLQPEDRIQDLLLLSVFGGEKVYLAEDPESYTNILIAQWEILKDASIFQNKEFLSWWVPAMTTLKESYKNFNQELEPKLQNKLLIIKNPTCFKKLKESTNYDDVKCLNYINIKTWILSDTFRDDTFETYCKLDTFDQMERRLMMFLVYTFYK